MSAGSHNNYSLFGEAEDSLRLYSQLRKRMEHEVEYSLDEISDKEIKVGKLQYCSNPRRPGKNTIMDIWDSYCLTCSLQENARIRDEKYRFVVARRIDDLEQAIVEYLYLYILQTRYKFTAAMLRDLICASRRPSLLQDMFLDTYCQK